MNTGHISTRYATALLDYAIEKGQHEEVYAKMKLLAEVFLKVRIAPCFAGSLYSQKDKANIIRTRGGTSVGTRRDERVDLEERKRGALFNRLPSGLSISIELGFSSRPES